MQQPQTRDIGPRLELAPLQAFVGRWSTEGHQHAGPFGPAGEVLAVERWYWQPGKRRLAHRFDGRIAAERVAWVDVVSAGSQLGVYDVATHARGGPVSAFTLEVEREDVWSMHGRTRGLELRCSMALERAHGVLRSRWDWSQDGTTWRVLRELTATRAEAP